MSFKPILLALVTIAALSAFSFNALAQGTTSRITGTVTDGSGSAVSGATSF